MKREEEVAYHEAGHAVMAALTGRRIKSATIIPDEDTGDLGSVELADLPAWFHPDCNRDNKHRNWIEREVMFDFAGQIAQKKAAGRKAGSWSDDHNAVDAACYMVQDSRELDAYLAWLYTRAENLIA